MMAPRPSHCRSLASALVAVTVALHGCIWLLLTCSIAHPLPLVDGSGREGLQVNRQTPGRQRGPKDDGYRYRNMALLSSINTDEVERAINSIALDSGSLLHEEGLEAVTCAMASLYKYTGTDACQSLALTLAGNATLRAVEQHVHFHAVFDFKRPSSLSLSVINLCHAIALCIPRSNFHIVLQADRSSIRDYIIASRFLHSLAIPHLVWIGEFDTKALQQVRLQSLRNVTGYNNFILQVDSDEIPRSITQASHLLQLIHRMSKEAVVSSKHGVLDGSNTGKTATDTSSSTTAVRPCDITMGFLYDRLPLDGALRNITLPSHLDADFPLTCNVKGAIESAQKRKTAFYRATYRPGIGNHQLICTHMNVSACKTMITASPHLQAFHPPVKKSPRVCRSTAIRMDHYKYTWGLQRYLERRVYVFKSIGLPWHSESTSLLFHLNAHNGTICVKCPETRCHH